MKILWIDEYCYSRMLSFGPNEEAHHPGTMHYKLERNGPPNDIWATTSMRGWMPDSVTYLEEKDEG